MVGRVIAKDVLQWEYGGMGQSVAAVRKLLVLLYPSVSDLGRGFDVIDATTSFVVWLSRLSLQNHRDGIHSDRSSLFVEAMVGGGANLGNGF